MYHSERKLTVHNTLLIAHGLFKMESNICTVVHGVKEERRRECCRLRKIKRLTKNTKFVNLCPQLSLHFDNDTSY